MLHALHNMFWPVTSGIQLLLIKVVEILLQIMIPTCRDDFVCVCMHAHSSVCILKCAVSTNGCVPTL
jgi:hypothetical protein